MSKCMESGKPQISILMAVYEPRIDWLKEQLLSLDTQTYPNLKLYIRDDSSSMASFSEIQACVEECIISFPYTIERNENNLGSNRTFEKLTEEAEGVYFAYCDQDDIWLPEKLMVLWQELEKDNALLVCSDMYIIDGDGKQIADSITKVRKRHKFQSGENLAEGLLFHNFASGCTMLVRAEEVKAALPFCPYMVHDHYLALWCASRGRIQSLEIPLIFYRIHGGNQTGVLAGVTGKESYRTVRIDTVVKKLLWLRENQVISSKLREEIECGIKWAKARQRRFEGRPGTIKTIWNYRRFGPLTALFEIIAAGFPDKIFMIFISIKRRNWV